MRVYIVATTRDEAGKIIGYTLLDLDDNYKNMTIRRESLIAAMKSKSINIINARLITDKNGVESIKGIKYNISDLSYSVNTNSALNKDNGILLPVPEIAVAYIKGKVMIYRPTVDNIKVWLKKNYIINSEEVLGWLASKRINVEAKPIAVNTPKVAGRDLEKSSVVNTPKVAGRDLEAEARNGDIVWTLEDFDRFMKRHNWSYSINKNNDTHMYVLKSVDRDCKILHLPDGIIALEMNDNFPNKLDIMIIPKTLVCWAKYRSEYLEVQIDKLCIQKRNKAFTYNSVNPVKMYVKTVVLPETSFEIQGMFNGWTIDYINETVNFSEIDNCFNNTTIKCGMRTLNIEKTIRGSFKKSSINLENLTIKKGTEDHDIIAINGSFLYCDALKRIQSEKDITDKLMVVESFGFCDNLKEIDVMGVKETEIIRSFNYCKAIEEVKVSELVTFNTLFGRVTDKDVAELKLTEERLTGFANDGNSNDFSVSFNKSPIKRFYIDEGTLRKLGHLDFANFDNSTTLELGEKVTDIGGIRLKNSTLNVIIRAQQLRLKSVIDYLSLCGYNVFDRACSIAALANIKNTPYIDRVTDFLHTAFSDFAYTENIGLFDTGWIKNWHTITNGALAGVSIETLIINSNITAIDEGVLSNIYSIQNIVIDDTNFTMDIDLKVFKHKFVMRAYVLRDSKAAKAFKRWKNRFITIEVDSVEEAMQLINKKDESKSLSYKLKMMLPGTPNAWLLDYDTGKNEAATMYTILSKAIKNEQEPELSLNTGKFMTTGLFNLNKLIEKVPELYTKSMENVKDHRGTYKHDNRFVSLCNLFTRVFERSNEMYRQDLWNAFFNDLVANSEDDIYVDMIFSDSSGDKIYQLVMFEREAIPVNAVVIEVGNVVQFIADADLIGMYSDFLLHYRDFALCSGLDGDIITSESYINNTFYTMLHKDNLSNYSLADELKIGDVIKLEDGGAFNSLRNIVNGVEIPYKNSFAKGGEAYIARIFKETWIAVGWAARESKKYVSKANMIFYNIIRQDFIEVISEQRYNEFMKHTLKEDTVGSVIKKISGIRLSKGIMSFDEVDKRYFKQFEKSKCGVKNKEIIDSLLLDDASIQMAYNNINNYDIGINTNVSEAVDFVEKLGASNVYPLSINAIGLFIKLGFFSEAKEITYQTVAGKRSQYVNKDTYKIGDVTVTEFRNNDTVLMLESNKGNKVSRVFLRSMVSIGVLLRILNELSQTRVKSNGSPEILDRVEDKLYKNSDFKILKLEHSASMHTCMAVGIENKGLNVFIILIDTNSQDVIPVIRCKTVCGAYEIFKYLSVEHSARTVLSRKYLGDGCVFYTDKQVESIEENNQFLKLRRKIMEGFPNNLIESKATNDEELIGFVKLISKQPKGKEA